ncbi:heat shock factor protein 1-like [Cimex lectularius]|uniref:HSF-type DNA-binding domain-containing protein n=1 Tax=Cimex lectularius TaxID=79782 RepID=A0A8I6R6S4_CIMLE|nr:heat shock factor protein 1-like [Cimex lectularius]
MSVTAFLKKLWHMVCDEKTEEVISWSENGKCFIIKDQIVFTSELLPKYYKHNNLSSFTRQLNKYGFRRVSNPESFFVYLAFEHPSFVKGDYSSMLQIRRKISSKCRSVEEKEDDPQGSNDSSLEAQIRQMRARQEEVETQLSANKIERDALWREHSILRQKQQQQSQLINSLIQFLISLIRPNNNVRRSVPLMLKDTERNDINLCAKIKEVQQKAQENNHTAQDNISDALIEETISPGDKQMFFTSTSQDEISNPIENCIEESLNAVHKERRQGLKRPWDIKEEETEEPMSILVPSTDESDSKSEIELLKDFLMYDNIPYPSRLMDLFGSEDPLGLKLPETDWKETQEDNEIVVYNGINDLFINNKLSS